MALGGFVSSGAKREQAHRPRQQQHPPAPSCTLSPKDGNNLGTLSAFPLHLHLQRLSHDHPSRLLRPHSPGPTSRDRDEPSRPAEDPGEHQKGGQDAAPSPQHRASPRASASPHLYFRRGGFASWHARPSFREALSD
ncbi:hypothetical protein CMUS01_10348 [Colletotrichum musicola]|uniref:Uncharacterized protein n=1 Tax=Colletotrichum musicola TaxID=2175873 RepID=A0A8H6K3H8_9PEZI|nr:hypothetical protein CMUS01_10348 [Colletotrichum musicola]